MEKTYTFLIGASKSGTSSLCYNFKNHPQVAISTPKEPNFFSNTNNRPFEIETYRQYWSSNRKSNSVFLDASPSYTHQASEITAQRICNVFPDAKLIYILRDPIERLVSHFNFNVSRMHWNYHGDLLNDILIEISEYQKHIRAYLRYFDHKQLLLINFEDLRSEPKIIVQQVCSHLGVDENYEPPEFRELAITKEITRMEYWNWHYRLRYLGPIHPVIFNPVIRKRLQLDQRLPKRIPTDQERQILQKRFADTIEYLADELNFDTSQWNTSRPNTET